MYSYFPTSYPTLNDDRHPKPAACEIGAIFVGRSFSCDNSHDEGTGFSR